MIMKRLWTVIRVSIRHVAVAVVLSVILTVGVPLLLIIGAVEWVCNLFERYVPDGEGNCE